MSILDSLYVILGLQGQQQAMSGLKSFQANVLSVKKSIGTAVGHIGYGGLFGAAGVTGLVGGGFVKLAADMEHSRAMLSRLVSDSGFKELTNSIDDMSTRIPVAVGRLYEIAGAAAQVGVKGTDNIAKVTESIAKMSVISGMNAEAVTKDFAKIANVFGIPMSKAENIGSLIIGRAHASAGDPAELIGLTQAMSGMASAIHMTLPETVALAATIKDAGMTAEVGASQFTKIMAQMEESPDSFAKLLGTTTNEFKKLRDEHPFQTMIDSFKAVRDQPDAENQIAALHMMGATGIRGDRVMQIIMALEKASMHAAAGESEFKNATDLQDKFAKTSKDTYAALQKLGNSFSLLADKLNRWDLNLIKSSADMMANAIVSALKPAVVKLGVGGGVPGAQQNIGAPPPPGPGGPFRAQNMGVPRNAPVVPPPPPKVGPPAPPTPDKLAEEARANIAKIDKMNADIAAAKKEEDTAAENEKNARNLADKRQKMIDAAMKDNHTSGVGKDRMMERLEKKHDEAFGEWVATWGPAQATRQKTINLEMARDKFVAKFNNPFVAPVIPPNQDHTKVEPDMLTKQGARKFAFDQMVNPQGFQQFQRAFASLPKDLANTDAGKEIAKKLAAMGGVDVKKNMTEEELTALLGKRAGAIANVTDAVARERVGRLYARPTFQGAEESWKRIAAGAAEGDPMTKILKENARYQKETRDATKELNGLIQQGVATIENNQVIMVGNP